jgi:hypothetical protein
MINRIAIAKRALEHFVSGTVRPDLLPSACASSHIKEAVPVGVHGALPDPAFAFYQDFGPEAILILNCRRSIRHASIIPPSIRCSYTLFIGTQLMEALA